MIEPAWSRRIGVVGVGDMGGAIAGSMCEAGLDVVVFDVRRDHAERLRDKGAAVAATLDALVDDADVISIVVVSDDQVRDVGTAVVERARPGTIVIVHSTVRPETVMSLAALGGTKEVAVLDVSVNGGAEKASRGLLTLMIGGDPAAVEQCRPIFDAIGSHVFHLGPSGSGLVGKLVNNLIAIGSYALQLEAVQLGAAYGIDEDAVATVVTASQGDCRGMRTWGRHDRKRAARAAAGVDWSERMGRDLFEAAIAAGHKGVVLPLTAAAAEGLPLKLRQRDRYLATLPPKPPIPRCAYCDQELAPPFRAAGIHPECH